MSLKWKFLGFVIFVSLGIFLVSQKRTRERVAEYNRTTAVGIDSCANKKFCLNVYVAPWCPACHAIKSYLIDAGKIDKGNYGIKVIVGDAEASKLVSEASTYGHIGSTDVDGSVAKRYKVTAYPSFYLTDADGSTIVDGQEARELFTEKFLK